MPVKRKSPDANTANTNGKNKIIKSAKCNYNVDNLVNKQIMRELQASHEYRSLAAWARHNSYFNSAKIFKEMQEDELKHSNKWTTYQDERRGEIEFEEISKPISFNKIKSLKHAYTIALDMELQMNEHLNNFHEISDEISDYNLSSFIDEFIADQITDQRELEAIICFCNSGHNDYDIDYKLAKFLETVKER